MIYKAEDLWNKDSPYLEHKFGFKYLKKIPLGVGKGFRYFYTQAQIAAYNASKTVNNTYKAANNFVKSIRAPRKTHQQYTKPGERQYFTKNTVQNKDKNLIHGSGTDENGYKYVAKVKLGFGKTRYFYSEEEYEAYKNRQFYQDPKNEPEFMKEFAELKEPRTAEEDSLSVNTKIMIEKGKGSYIYNPDPDYTTNCAECTMIYEMRRRGYDVEYNEKTNISGSDPYSESKNYNYDRRLSYCFEKPETYKFPMTPNVKEFETFMKKTYPPNSRGDISVEWKGTSSGHSMVWETDSKGRVTIRDSQISGTGMEAVYDAKTLLMRSNGVRITRLDNLKPKKAITKIIQNRKSTRKPLGIQQTMRGGRNAHWSDAQQSKAQMYTKYPNYIRDTNGL